MTQLDGKVPRLERLVGNILEELVEDGVKRVDRDYGDLKISGYWVGNLIRIDIKQAA